MSISTSFIPNCPYYFTTILSNSTISLTYVMKKTLQIMRISFFMLFVTLFQVVAVESYSQSATVSVDAKHISLGKTKSKHLLNEL